MAPALGNVERLIGPAAREAIWSVAGGARLAWRAWDHDEVLVYNLGSGETHLLDAFSAAALREIADHPRTIDDLRRALVERFALDEIAVAERLAPLCDTFQRLGLAEPEAP